MSRDPEKQQVIIIVGPTAVGKTQLSVDLAQQINGEIISADSRYLYRGMNIGSAKPSLIDMKGVPHHMIDVADPGEIWSMAHFLENTKLMIKEITARSHRPIIVGGTGQYIRALTEGWKVPELEPNPKLRSVLSEMAIQLGDKELYRKLEVLDPDAAKFIDASNVRRTIRALEVIFTTGEKFSFLRKKTTPEFDFWVIGLMRNREELYEIIDRRIEKMFDDGLVQEVQALMSAGYTAELPSMSAIGYKEVLGYIAGDISLDGAKTLIKRNTRQFVRRQANWFKPTDPVIHWYSMEAYPLELILSDLKSKFLTTRV